MRPRRTHPPLLSGRSCSLAVRPSTGSVPARHARQHCRPGFFRRATVLAVSGRHVICYETPHGTLESCSGCTAGTGRRARCAGAVRGGMPRARYRQSPRGHAPQALDRPGERPDVSAAVPGRRPAGALPSLRRTSRGARQDGPGHEVSRGGGDPSATRSRRYLLGVAGLAADPGAAVCPRYRW